MTELKVEHASDASGLGKKPTVKDVARVAGVSLATVDRVLNKRKGVRPATVTKVEQAVAELGFNRDVSASLLARAKGITIHFVLPYSSNPFMDQLRQAISECSDLQANARLDVQVRDVAALDAAGLSAAIDDTKADEVDCLVIVARDDDQVRRAVARAKARGLPVITLVSDLPESQRAAFVGIDNVAAGRTAGALMGRFLRPGDQVGLIVGSLDLRDHRERFMGFSDALLEDFPEVEIVGPAEGFDDVRETARRTSEFLNDYPRIAGIYSIGSGNDGLFQALGDRVSPKRKRVIVHELTNGARQALKDGYCDIVLDQNPRGEAEAALKVATALALSKSDDHDDFAIEIGIYLRDNLMSK